MRGVDGGCLAHFRPPVGDPLRLKNKTIADVLAEWRRQAERYQEQRKRAVEGMRYDPVTGIYY